jgi:hypothetical protein
MLVKAVKAKLSLVDQGPCRLDSLDGQPDGALHEATSRK